MEITNDKGEKIEVFTKEEMSAKDAEFAKINKELEDTRMEVLTPEYSKFLESLNSDKDKDKGKDKGKEKDPDDDEDLSKLTPKQLIARAKKEALEEFNATLDKQNKETRAEKESRNKREIAAFAKVHTDFEEFRPVMYGLSLKTEHADMTLPQLYEAAKDHVKKIKTGTSDNEKEKQKKLGNEKPGGGNDTFDKKQAKTGVQYGAEALAEVEKELGPLPSA